MTDSLLTAAMPRIYLDNAATSWPKPEAVYRAVDDYQRRLGAPAGRGSYAEAAETERIVASCRKQIAAADRCGRSGANHLHAEWHRLAESGDARLAASGRSCGDHGLRAQFGAAAAAVSGRSARRRTSPMFPATAKASSIPMRSPRRSRPKTRLIAMLHASNVTGAIQPAAEVGRIAAEHGVSFCSMRLSRWAISRSMCPQSVAICSRRRDIKGCWGRWGPACCIWRQEWSSTCCRFARAAPARAAMKIDSSRRLPDRYEVGQSQCRGHRRAGGGRGVPRGAIWRARIAEACTQLTQRLLERARRSLAACRCMARVNRKAPRRRQLEHRWISTPRSWPALLDSQWSIQTRSGLHCAPRMHAALGTAPSGTLRLSLGHFTTRRRDRRCRASDCRDCRGLTIIRMLQCLLLPPRYPP